MPAPADPSDEALLRERALLVLEQLITGGDGPAVRRPPDDARPGDARQAVGRGARDGGAPDRAPPGPRARSSRGAHAWSDR